MTERSIEFVCARSEDCGRDVLYVKLVSHCRGVPVRLRLKVVPRRCPNAPGFWMGRTLTEDEGESFPPRGWNAQTEWALAILHVPATHFPVELDIQR